MITENQTINRINIARFMYERVLPASFDGSQFHNDFLSESGCLIYHAMKAGVLPNRLMEFVRNGAFNNMHFSHNQHFRVALDEVYGWPAAYVFCEEAERYGKDYGNFYRALLKHFCLERTDVEFSDGQKETVRYFLVIAHSNERFEVHSENFARKELATLQKYGVHAKILKIKTLETSEEIK